LLPEAQVGNVGGNVVLPVVTFLDRLVQPFPLFLALEAASCTALVRVMP
jgi:hypothetical protein